VSNGECGPTDGILLRLLCVPHFIPFCCAPCSREQRVERNVDGVWRIKDSQMLLTLLRTSHPIVDMSKDLHHRKPNQTTFTSKSKI